MDRVVLKHLTGSKAHQVEEFGLDGFGDVLIGRDPSAGIRYDADRDDLVGRHHARLVQDPADRYRFTIVDLNSRNGTYVNRKRVAGPVALSSGDVIQLGPGGPEFEFTIERDVPVGKATVERLVASAQRRTRRTFFLVLAAVAVVAIGSTAVLFYRAATGRRALTREITETRREIEQAQRAAPMSPAEIARQYSEAVVFIEVGWKLIFTQTGEQVYHEYYVDTDQQGNPVTNKAGEVVPVPIYMQLPDGRIEPSLSLDRGEFHQNQPIGGRLFGTGFVAARDGFILTSRHVAASWETTYAAFPDRPGRLVKLDSRDVGRLDAPPRDWVPATARVLGRRAIVGKNVEGRLDYLDVTFANTRLRVPAKLVRVSDRHDVAMLKIDLPQTLKSVQMFDSPDVRPGMTVTILGYPSISPTLAVVTRSEDPFNREPQRRSVPEPTVTNGLIGRVVRGEVSGATETETFGDSYQMTANAAGTGNSGGPVFDDRGRVIGIFFASGHTPDARVTFAVPIRYGLELMHITPVAR
jgi:S1-C subfamily serine protease